MCHDWQTTKLDNILFEKPCEKKPSGECNFNLRGDIKINLMEIDWENVNQLRLQN
jgi:hypothetical protein